MNPDQIRCEYNQKWSNPPPKCEPVSCYSFPTLPHATKIVTKRSKRHIDEPSPPDSDITVKQAPTVKQQENFVFADIATFECVSGYELEESEVNFVRCDSHGNWTTPYPVCIPITCEPLPEM